MPSSSVSFFPIPTAGTTEGTANFSIPVDEFAFLQMSCAASSSSSGSTGTGSGGGATAAGGGQWLDEGDTVSTTATGSDQTTSSVDARITASAVATILINATAVKKAISRGEARLGSTGTANVEHTVSADYSISRFDK